MQVSTKYLLFLCFIHATMKQLLCLQEVGSEIYNPQSTHTKKWTKVGFRFIVSIYWYLFVIFQTIRGVPVIYLTVKTRTIQAHIQKGKEYV